MVFLSHSITFNVVPFVARFKKNLHMQRVLSALWQNCSTGWQLFKRDKGKSLLNLIFFKKKTIFIFLTEVTVKFQKIKYLYKFFVLLARTA